jgi:5-deoxy-glucuronate isomerase
MSPLIRAASTEVPYFTSEILSAEDHPDVGINLTINKLRPEDSVTMESEACETAVLALSGRGSLVCNSRRLHFDRPNWTDTNPTVIHAPAGVSIGAGNEGSDPVEVLVLTTRNTRKFAPRYYTPDDIQVEQRGKGILDETCYRLVRLAFDDTNGPPESNLVLGEVINFAGRWSSYPPHHHAQPEIYYYRFDPPQGYGHGELGDEVFKIRSGDVLAITGDRSHCQVSAPGYTMYYLWAVRHLEGSRYKGFTFEPEHVWTLQKKSRNA